MDTPCRSRINHDEDLVGYLDDDQGENIESQRPQNNIRQDSGFVLNVNASCMQIGRQNDISFGPVDKTSDSEVNESDESVPVLTEYWGPAGKLSVGRSRSGFPDCKYDHLVQLLVRKNKYTREALDITDNYKITMTVTYHEANGSSFQMPDYQCKRLKTETQCGVNRSMVGVVGFLFRFHEPNTKYKITCTLLTNPTKRGGKTYISRETNACKKLSEISVVLETGERSKWKSVKPREKTEVRKVSPSFALGPASLSKTNAKLLERSVSVVNQLQSLRNDGKWEDFDNLSCDLLQKFPDPDTQITVKLEQGMAALYTSRNDFERALHFFDESFKLMSQAKNMKLLAGRGYGYLAGIARRLKNLGEATSFMQLAEQNSHKCSHSLLDKSYIAYEKASVLLDFIGLAPQKSLQQVKEALDNLERCIDLCNQLEKDDNDLCIQRHHFAFIKIAMLLLDCRTDAARERVVSRDFIAKGEECLRTLKTKYWTEVAESVEIQFYLASSDLEYRKRNYREAERFANLAKDKAENFGFNTEISQAEERLDHIRVVANIGRNGNDSRLFTPTSVAASEGDDGDISSSASESDWLQILD
ncbi:hypothetical protein ABFA07_015703 [Porites harrisoni]